VRQLRDLVLASHRLDRIGQSRIRDQRVGGDLELARRRHQPRAGVPERVLIARDRQRGRSAKLIRLEQVGYPRRMDVEHQHHRGARHKLIDEFEADTNLHE